MKNLRVIFMGTPDFACEILKSLIDTTNVILVVSQPDRLVGRKKILTASPVKKLAEENSIEVSTPQRIKIDYEDIAKLNPDLIVTCAYGQIIPKELLTCSKYGAINVHASLLPKYRGGAPIQRAIMAGDKVTGITIMYMDEFMDSGDIISQREVPIDLEDNLDTLNEKMKKAGADLLIDTLRSISSGTSKRIKQDDAIVTYAPIIKHEDELLDFSKTTKEVYDHIRALSSNPGAYFILNGKTIKVYASKMGEKRGPVGRINSIYKDGIGIGTSDGEIIITDIKPEGKNRISVKDYLNGIRMESLKGVDVNARVD